MFGKKKRKSKKWMMKTMLPVDDKGVDGKLIEKEVSVWDAIQFLNQQTARVNDLNGMALELLGQLYLDRPNNEFFSSKLCGEINLKAAQTQAEEIKRRREEEKKKLVPLKRGGGRGRR